MFQIHVTTEDMKNNIPSIDVLPKEMGGKVPMAEMIELFKMELSASRNSILALDQMKILNDSGIIGRRNVDKNNNAVSGDSEQVIGSFRKLEIDWIVVCCLSPTCDKIESFTCLCSQQFVLWSFSLANIYQSTILTRSLECIMLVNARCYRRKFYQFIDSFKSCEKPLLKAT